MKQKAHTMTEALQVLLVLTILVGIPISVLAEGDDCPRSVVLLDSSMFLKPIKTGPAYWIDDITSVLTQDGDIFSLRTSYNHPDSGLFDILDPDDIAYLYFEHTIDQYTGDYTFGGGVSFCLGGGN